jgi:OOP family OmpA-OmpF porin
MKEGLMEVVHDTRSRRRIWFWGILGLVILLILCVWIHGRGIPRDIANNVGAALTAEGFRIGKTTAVDGRDVVLNGEIGENIDRVKLVEIVRSVPGVRTVTDKLTVVKTEPSSLVLKEVGDSVTLKGMLPTQEAVDKVVRTASVIYGADKVADEMSVHERARDPAWLNGLAAFLPEFQATEEAGIEASGSKVVLTGLVDSPEKRAVIGEKAQEAFPDEISVDNQIRVAASMESPHLRYQIANGMVTLSGELPNKEAVDEAVAAAQSLFGRDRVKSEITISDRVSEPPWLARLEPLVSGFGAVKTAGIEMRGDRIVLTGIVDSASKRAAIESEAREVVGDLPVENRIQVISSRLSSRLAYRMAQGGVTLQGELPGQEAVDKAVAAVRPRFARNKIINELTISDKVTNPTRLDGVTRSIREFTAIETAGIVANDEGVTLTGIVDTADRRLSIGSRVQSLVGDVPVFNRIVVVNVPKEGRQKTLTDLDFPPVHFRHATTQLTDFSKEVLNRVAALLLQFPEVNVEIGGHTDSSGNDLDNLRLSENRANAVVEYLVAKGIDPGRLVPRGYGETRPIADNRTKEGRMKNRRIEFKVIE